MTTMLRLAGICEDDEALRTTMQRALEQAEFRVRVTGTGAAALAAFTEDPPDVMVLDIGLPDADGRAVCRTLRERGVSAPALFLGPDDTAAEPIAPEDDYLAKPFALAALLVRIGALARPRAGDPDTTAHLDRAARAIVAGPTRIGLTPTEFRLLDALTARRGEVVTRAELVGAGWPGGATVTDNTLDAYLARLRRKLRDAGAEQAIRTCRGMGYELR